MNAHQPGKIIARGRTADIHAYGDGFVLKLFHPWMDLEGIRREAAVTARVAALGLPVPAVGELLEHNGRSGLVIERIGGRSMSEAVVTDASLMAGAARRLANLHRTLHRSRLDEPRVPFQRERLAAKLRAAAALDSTTRGELLDRLAGMPDGDVVCHGDFHPENVMLGQSRAVVIDWMDATRGNPLADVARTSVLLDGAAAAQIPDPNVAARAVAFHDAYRSAYFASLGGARANAEAEYRRWLPIVAGARLSEEIAELEPWLLARAREPAR